LSGKSKGVGEAGVGGGGCGGSSSFVVEIVLLVDSGAVLVPVPVSVSVSEPDDSRSQLSATGLDLGLCRGFCGTVVESFSCDRVFAISGELCQWCDQAWVMGWGCTCLAGRFADGLCGRHGC
jgi:hypothetical protein